jgi:hypothetical protein
LREEQWQRVFENRVLMKIFERKRDEATGKWKRYLTSICIIYTLRQILFA